MQHRGKQRDGAMKDGEVREGWIHTVLLRAAQASSACMCVLVRERERENTTLLVVKGYRSKKKQRGNVRKMFLVSTGTAVN